jgi:hypothetical protein
MAYGLIIVCFIICSVEAYASFGELQKRITSIPQTNYLSPKANTLYNAIDKADCQAIMSIPVIAVGTDKIGQFPSIPLSEMLMQISYAKQLPIINGQMTRNSLAQQMMMYQLAGNELLRKELIPFLKPKQPILILADTGICTNDDKVFLKKCKYQNSFEGYLIYQLQLDSLQYKWPTSNPLPLATDYTGQFIHKQMTTPYICDIGPTQPITISGLPGHHFWHSKAEPIVLYQGKWPMPENNYEASVWVKLDPLHEGTPIFEISSWDKFGKLNWQKQIQSGASYDIYNDYTRVHLDFDASMGDSIKVSIQDKDCLAFHFLIHAKRENIWLTNQNKFWYNNFPLF